MCVCVCVCVYVCVCVCVCVCVSPCQDPAGNRTTQRLPDYCKEMQTAVVWSPVHQVWPKPYCKAQWKGKEDKADRGRGGKTASGNGQAWSSPSPRGQWRTEKWRKLVAKSSVVPQRPLQLRDRWDERESASNMFMASVCLQPLLTQQVKSGQKMKKGAKSGENGQFKSSAVHV